MFDAAARRLIDPPLDAAGRRIAATGISPNQITLAGLATGLLAAGLIWAGHSHAALLPLVLSRLADGLDGAVARATHKSDFGGYLDIACDFLFYGLVPLAFVLNDPAQNAVAGAVLLTAFYFNGTSFLGYAILAAKHGIETRAQGSKSLYFSNGLLEGSETIGFFVLLCLLPQAFAPLAFAFGALCFITGALRIHAASRAFPPSQESP